MYVHLQIHLTVKNKGTQQIKALQVEGKAAITTGAGSGINLSYHTQDFSTTSSRARFFYQKTDVTGWKRLDEMFEAAIKNFWGANIVCPGAEIYESVTQSAHDKTIADFHNQLLSNFPLRQALGHQEMTKYNRATRQWISSLLTPSVSLRSPLLTFMKRRRRGVVTHVWSVAGQVPYFPTPRYVAAKHALNGVMRSLERVKFPSGHLTHMPKIRVNAVTPARTFTPFWTDNPDKLKMLSDNPGWILPKPVLEVILDLVTNDEYGEVSMVEVGDGVRVVQTYGDPGPMGRGNAVQHDKKEEQDIWNSIERQLCDNDSNATDVNGTR